MNNRFLGIVFALALAGGSAQAKDSVKPKGPDEDGTKPALTSVAGEGFYDSHAYAYLTELSDDVGARVTGSPSARKAINWGASKMTSMGLVNVHQEKWSVWKGWTRGTASAELLEPLHRTLTVDAMGWTGSTPEAGAEAEVATANLFDMDTELSNITRFRGKIVLMKPEGVPRKNFWMLFAQYGDFLKALHKAGAVAVIGGQGGFKAEGMHLTHTGILGFAQDFDIPVVDMTMEDEGQLERFLDSGKTVKVRINVQNTLTGGPVESANVVGDILGREHPEEIVVVGAHLDSWDLSEGATDNGTGATAVLAAAEAILKSGQRPRRTIRFVLFTGEEQGLLGSLAYVKQHAAEMKNHVACVVLDDGQGPIKEFQLGGRNDLIDSMKAFADSLDNIREIAVTDKREFGTDTGPFILAGLPGINLDQDSPDYKYTHHSAADALEQVKPDVLTQDATIMALTAFWIADRPERFATPWPAERTAKMLREKGDYDMLKSFNLWTFGNLGMDNQN
ncbi:MAG TPA: M20/M25/M40 family metallo-hydrolase [Candidatus Acidoferrales bacterium]|jgi:carboxypeptidase Q|nr:M20/M25/M40 family metallo-hydrolase [Candidatus Acidoferrales bacterium]